LLSLPAISEGVQLALKHFFTRASTEAKAEVSGRNPQHIMDAIRNLGVVVRLQELNWPTPIAAGVRDAVVGREVVVLFEEAALGVKLEDTLTLTQGSVMQVSEPVGEIAFAKVVFVLGGNNCNYNLQSHTLSVSPLTGHSGWTCCFKNWNYGLHW
jgi:hypothetical protein